jgi:hypothetical protein
VKVFVTGTLGFGRAPVERSRAGGAEVSGMESAVSGGTDMGTVRWDRVAAPPPDHRAADAVARAKSACVAR